MPKDTASEREERARAMEEGYKVATRVPMNTVKLCHDAAELCMEMAALADPEMVSDVGTGAHMALAGAQAAAYNVRINLRHIDDTEFVDEMRSEVRGAVSRVAEMVEATVVEVEGVLDRG